MILEISDTCLTLSIVQKMWEAVKQTYSKACDAAQVYEIKMRAIPAKEGNRTVTEYANELKGLWQVFIYQVQIHQYIQVYIRIPLVLMPQTHHTTNPGSLIQGQLIT